MDLPRAYAVLGVEPQTPLAEVKRRYRMRAQMLHPDHQTGSSELLSESQRAMAELTDAWRTVKSAEENGRRHDFVDQTAHSSAKGPADAQPRLPFEGECDMCGCMPAARIELRRTRGMVLGRQDQVAIPDLCRTCGLSLFRELQSASLTGGWWGISAFFVNIGNLFRNLAEVRRHQTLLDPPNYRDPAVMAPFPPGLRLARPVLRRLGPMLSTAAVAGVLVIAVAYVVAPPDNALDGGGIDDSSDISEGPDQAEDGSSEAEAALGICLDTDGGQVECGSSAATWQIKRLAASNYDCYDDETVFEATDGQLYCAGAAP